MGPGTVVADRFEVEHLAGKGGMGMVYRARDRASGETVALKILRDNDREPAARFAREARVLAELRHPGIVRYVSHGIGHAGLFLAMEWLEGESLSDRFQRQGLTLEESLTLVRRVAEALAVAHRQGIVHRDLKPSNLFLVGGTVDNVKVLDFGIARLRDYRRELTTTGAMLGTPGNMAPEQARGDRGIDARADLFSLGCVLFKCLTGRPPFYAGDGLGVLLRVVLEDAPRVKDLRPEVPASLDALVARMLAKAPADRPEDGAALLSAVAALGSLSGERAAHHSTVPPALTTTERRVACLVVARVGRRDPAEAPTTLSSSPPPLAPPGRPDMTVSTDLATRRMDTALVGDTIVEAPPSVAPPPSHEANAVREVVERHGGMLHALADGSLLVTVETSGAATDQASSAAQCALAMRPLLDGVPMALVAGRAVMSTRVPIGEVIDRAVALVATEGDGIGTDSDPSVRAGSLIRLDEVAAGLLGDRFDVGGDATGLFLRGTRDVVEMSRTLLGRPSPCVGRERELTSLEATFDECVDEPMARAVLVTAVAGVGKSRIRYELLSKLRSRRGPLEVWFARGDPMSAGSPFGMIVRAVQRAAGLLDGEPLAVRQHKLRARVSRHLSSGDRARVTEFLGELAGVPYGDEQSVQLRAARQDPMLMGDQMRRAWEDWLAAECTAQPVLFVLEDLQWGDLPSVRFIDSALRNLHDRPWMVLALGRPEVHELFPKLWAGRAVTQVHLGDLTRRGSERLVREVLGTGVTDATVARLVERAAGNAFYLEELIRAVAAGRGDDTLPETVLAMVQARLEGLAPDVRRVLRAASVFGQVFWSGGVATLLGGAERAQVDTWLSELCEQEVVTRRGEGKFPLEDEHIFRHALLREAAYAMLTDEDCTLGHRLAGEWLEDAGELEAVVMAEHLERGGEPARAVVWYRRAAEQALEGNDFSAVNARAERALECLAASGPKGDGPVAVGLAGSQELGALRLLQAEAHGWRGENADAERCAREAMRFLPRGSARWYGAVAEAALASGRLGNPEELVAVAQELESLERGEAGTGRQMVATAHTVGQLLYAGLPDRAEPLLGRIAQFESAADERDPAAWAWIHSVRATQALFAGDPGAYLKRRQSSAKSFEEAGDLRNVCVQRVSVGYAYMQLGAYRDAGGALREALVAAERMGLSNALALAKHNLGYALALEATADRGALEEARALESDAVRAFVAQGNRRLEGGARIYLAMILVQGDDLPSAHDEAKRAVEVTAATPPARAHALATLAYVELARGRIDAAREASSEAMALLESLGGIDEGESLVRLVCAQALEATGDHDRARAGLAIARERLLERAAKITDPSWRQSFLERVPENARTMQSAASASMP